jgi:hypothetical protein
VPPISKYKIAFSSRMIMGLLKVSQVGSQLSAHTIGVGGGCMYPQCLEAPWFRYYANQLCILDHGVKFVNCY